MICCRTIVKSLLLFGISFGLLGQAMPPQADAQAARANQNSVVSVDGDYNKTVSEHQVQRQDFVVERLLRDKERPGVKVPAFSKNAAPGLSVAADRQAARMGESQTDFFRPTANGRQIHGAKLGKPEVRKNHYSTIVTRQLMTKLGNGQEVPVIGAYTKAFYSTGNHFLNIPNDRELNDMLSSLEEKVIDGELPRAKADKLANELLDEVAELRHETSASEGRLNVATKKMPNVRSIDLPGPMVSENEARNVAARMDKVINKKFGLVDFAADKVELHDLAVRVYNGQAHLTYDVHVTGFLVGYYNEEVDGHKFNEPIPFKDSRLVIVDAHSGEALDIQDTKAHAYTEPGRVDAYREDPISNNFTPDRDRETSNISDAGNFSLNDTKYSNMHNAFNGDTFDTGYNFTYFDDGFPNDNWMADTTGHHHLNRFGMYKDKLRHDTLHPQPLEAWAADGAAFTSYYDFLANEARFASAAYFAIFAGDIAVHEYAHAMQDDATGIGNIEPCSDDDNSESDALCEGTAQYIATSYMGDRHDNEWEASFQGKPYYATYNNTLTYSDWILNDDHHNGGIVTAALWDYRKKVGQAIADATVMEALYYMDSTMSFDQYLENALIPAATSVTMGTFNNLIYKIFSLREIYGNQADPTTIWDDNGYAMSTKGDGTRGYEDGINETVYIANPDPLATETRAIFGAHTRFDEMTDMNLYNDLGDTAGVLDANDGFIESYTKEEAMSLVVSIPGNGFHIEVIDRDSNNPDNIRDGAGYRLMSVSAPPVGNNFTPRANYYFSRFIFGSEEPAFYSVRPTWIIDLEDEIEAFTIDPDMENGADNDDKIYWDVEEQSLRMNWLFITCDSRSTQAETVTLTTMAADSTGQVGTATRQFTVQPYDAP